MVDESAERQAILGVFHDLQDTWNRGDAAGYASLYTHDADFIAWNGQYGRGRQAIEDAHRLLFQGPLAGSRMVLVDDNAQPAALESLRFIRPDVAIVVIPGTVIRTDQDGPEADHQSMQTF